MYFMGHQRTMKTSLFVVCLLLIQISFGQERKTVTYRQWQDMPQDTYVRIISTADSLLEAYHEEPFNVERKGGRCCLKGLMVIKEFYLRALIEKPGDEDAQNKVKEIEELILDEELLLEEKQFSEIEKRGDYYFDKGYYKRSLTFYKRAYQLSPKYKPLKKKIKQTKKKIKKYENI